MCLPNHAKETDRGDPVRVPRSFLIHYLLSPCGDKFKNCFRLAALCSALIISTTAFGQSTAIIEGEITDQEGAVIPSAALLATNDQTGVRRETTSDEAGRYQMAALPIGTYHIEIKSTGFQSQIVK